MPKRKNRKMGKIKKLEKSKRSNSRVADHMKEEIICPLLKQG